MTLTSRPTTLINMIIWFTVTVLGIYLLFNINKYINFGIDLVGGTYITLEVETDKALENELVDKMQSTTRLLEKAEKELPTGNPRVENEQGILSFTSAAAAQVAAELANNERDPRVIIEQKDKDVFIRFTTQAARLIAQDAVEGNINVLRTRLDAFGLGEITIAAQGDKNILIELPNVDNPEQAKARIGKTALLEMKPVYDRAVTQEELISKQGGSIPEGTVIVPGRPDAADPNRFYLVPTYAELTGRSLKDAAYFQQREIFRGSPHSVSITFKTDAADKFYDLTSKNIGNAIAIIIDNIVISAPGVSEAISGGSANITSPTFTKAEAQEIASLLKAGVFVAPVKYVEERHIGPSLGKESIKQGLISCAIALGLLFAFSVLTYKTAGILAFIVLLYNLLLVLFGLVGLGATLTLPGIAGMILTVGMAIDSSILIYERIKEELAAGIPMRKAVQNGFSGATGVILDANITTFIVGAVLYWLGTGPIQGFASTLMLGIISTLVTGLLLLKSLFTIVFDVIGIQKLKI